MSLPGSSAQVAAASAYAKEHAAQHANTRETTSEASHGRHGKAMAKPPRAAKAPAKRGSDRPEGHGQRTDRPGHREGGPARRLAPAAERQSCPVRDGSRGPAPYSARKSRVPGRPAHYYPSANRRRTP